MDTKIKLQRIPLADLLPHPKNPNVTPPEVLEKIKRSIRRNGFYPPLLVRPLSRTKFQIIDGWHRQLILKDEGEECADCIVRDMDDVTADLLIASLNTLHGSDDKQKRAQLLADLAEQMPVEDLSLLLPEDADALKALLSAGNETEAIAAANASEKVEFEVLEFKVSTAGATVVREALKRIKDQVIKDGSASCADGTALEYLAANYISGA